MRIRFYSSPPLVSHFILLFSENWDEAISPIEFTGRKKALATRAMAVLQILKSTVSPPSISQPKFGSQSSRFFLELDSTRRFVLLHGRRRSLRYGCVRRRLSFRCAAQDSDKESNGKFWPPSSSSSFVSASAFCGLLFLICFSFSAHFLDDLLFVVVDFVL